MSLTMLTELQTAIIDGDISKAIALLYDDDNEIKRNINRPYYQSQYNSKVTTLYLACDYGIDQIVEILLAIPEIDVNYEAERGADTPLHAAASGGFTKIVELLLAVKCHCVASMFGSTPIQRAAGNGHPEVLALLLDYDKKKLINHETLNKTPLHWACKHGHLQCVKILVQHGADPTVRNPNNKCPVEMAMEKGHREIVRFLKGQEDEDVVTEQTEEAEDNFVAQQDKPDGEFNLRFVADLGAHQAYFEEEQLTVNRDYAKRITELESDMNKQESINQMVSDDILDVKAECQDLMSLIEEQDSKVSQLAEEQQQQGAFNTEVQAWINAMERSHNTHMESTSKQIKALAERVQYLEQKMGEQPQENANLKKSKELCNIVRSNFLVFKENMLASDHVDYLFSKGALTMDDVQAIQSKPYDLVKTQEMFYRLLGKRDPQWIYPFLKSLNRHQATQHLLQMFMN